MTRRTSVQRVRDLRLEESCGTGNAKRCPVDQGGERARRSPVDKVTPETGTAGLGTPRPRYSLLAYRTAPTHGRRRSSRTDRADSQASRNLSRSPGRSRSPRPDISAINLSTGQLMLVSCRGSTSPTLSTLYSPP